MTAELTPAQVAHYREHGFLAPLPAFSGAEAAAFRAELESFERGLGRALFGKWRYKNHLSMPFADRVVRHPAILDAVAALIGPDILVYHVTTWIKEPGDGGFVDWHQDSTYFALAPADQHVTAWVALSQSDSVSGCVRVAPGSHLRGQIPHRVDVAGANMLPVGQSLELPAGTPVADMPLAPGWFSLHHTHLWHQSPPNHSADRRIGLGISYIPTHCRNLSSVRMTATLARGVDRHGYFDPERRMPVGGPPDLAHHEDAVARWRAYRAEIVPRINAGETLPS